MNAIDALAGLLSSVNQMSMRGFTLPVAAEHERIHRDIQVRLRRRFDRRQSRNVEDGAERTQNAILACRDGAALDLRDLRRACAGCANVLRDGYVLLDDVDALAQLLRLVDAERATPRKFSQLYGRLISAYFGHGDLSEDGIVRREVLRGFLADRREAAIEASLLPNWSRVLADHPQLMSERPGTSFASDMLAGDWTEFRELSKALGSAGESWLSGAVIREAVRAAVNGSDDSFKSYIPSMLTVIREPRFSALRDESLSAIIDRYHRCQARDAHPELRDFAVVVWKNPWLEMSETAWARVTAPARQMVVDWLKLDLISEFFNLLAEDGHGDRSRFEFWRRYLDQINDMYFVIGRVTMNSPNPDIRKLRKKLDGRLLRLDDPVQTNDAFVMLTDKAAIVEFSNTGNATYIYHRGGLPVSLAGAKRVGVRELKDRSVGDHLIHVPGWQSQFEQTLRGRYGLVPDDEMKRITRAAQSRNGASPAPFSDTDFRHLMDREKLPWRDHRDKGGSLWVETESVPAHVASKLREWGFSHRPTRGWFISST